MGIIKAVIPFFFLLIGLELLLSVLLKKKVFRFSDSISDLSCGILSQLTGFFVALGTILIYLYFQKNWSIQAFTSIPAWPVGNPFYGLDAFPYIGIRGPELLAGVVAFVLVDFFYYWNHRWGHEINILWAGHVVHHSSEEYNLTVALRQSSFHGLFSWIIYLPLAFIGLPWELFVASNALNLVYQFWIHTRLVGKLPRWFEAVMNTPSHHRVHHGVNPKYIDKNYAGVFIIWDRLFGTFTPEEEEPVYGITTPLRSWDPVWANLDVFTGLVKDAARTRSWWDRIRVFFKPPGWRPRDVGEFIAPKEVSRAQYQKYHLNVPGAVTWYTLWQFALVVVGTYMLLTFAPQTETTPLWWSGAIALWLTLSLVGIAKLLELRVWAFRIEWLRTLGAAFLTLEAFRLDWTPELWAVGAGLALVNVLLFAAAWRAGYHKATSRYTAWQSVLDEPLEPDPNAPQAAPQREPVAA